MPLREVLPPVRVIRPALPEELDGATFPGAAAAFHSIPRLRPAEPSRQRVRNCCSVEAGFQSGAGDFVDTGAPRQ